MKRQFFGNPELLAKARNPCMKYVLDWEEWLQLIQTSNSLAQLRNVWAHVLRYQSEIDCPSFTAAALHEFERRVSPNDALLVFDSMVCKDIGSWIVVLATIAFSRCLGSRFKGSLSEAVQNFEKDDDKTQESLNSMLAAYAQHGQLLPGKQLFDNMPTRDHSSWNMMIASFAVNGELASVSETFKRMTAWDDNSWTALLAAYARKWDIANANEVFEGMPRRDVLAWNIKMACGGGVEALREMQLEGVSPDKSSFVCLLLGCKTKKAAGRYFWWMSRDHQLKPGRVHYMCMTDILRRAGLDDRLIKMFMKSFPTDKNWQLQ